ncbi:PKD domain-containing protein [Algoriphagus zhangzhouensis]|uniref:PKD domain-containing protein n=1 Tax=Algoriphagus zhangzhouensis TaxID=1073327 RepID=UPI001066CDA7|nr:PKD domain-containing protein [Algoriphagus zhangzhouensis]
MKFRLLLLSFLFLVLGLQKGFPQIGFPYCETFQTASTQASTIYGGSAQLLGGVLRLTTNENDQKGYIYIDVPFPSTYGIKAEFEYFMYGGSGADGLTVFLFDADVPNFAPGGFGGSLGYAQKFEQPGLTGAYMGLGFDVFGNFANSSEGKRGGFFGGDNNLYPNTIALRKGGTGTNGYDFVVGKITDDPPAGASGLALDVDYRFPLSSGGVGTQRVTDRNNVGYRKVFFELEPNPNGVGYLFKLEMEVTTEEGKPRFVTIFQDQEFNFPAPENLKIGFSASTGGFNNFHEIRNLIVQVSAEDELQAPIAVDFDDVASCEGQENQFYITDEDIELPNEGSEIRCLQFYLSKEDIIAQSEDVCTQARCLEQNRYLVLPEGTLQAGEKGAYTFFPNVGFAGSEVEVYYTITDNYGKTSAGNKITLKIQESPEPVSLLVSGKSETVEEVKTCPGDLVVFEAKGEEEYERFEWYRDGELLPGEESARLETEEEGIFEVWAYNRKNCPAKSNQVEIVFPQFPELEFEDLIVGCDPGQPVNIFEGIDSYDPENYDYRLVGNGLELENEEILTLDISGVFELYGRPKGYTCYSEPISLEVFIQEVELEIGYDFVVAGTDIRDDASGGIFPNDPIQFTDMSDSRTIYWNWDFGDGETSTERDPIHVYGKKGEFDVVLTITDQYGCERSLTKRVSITRSYRVMVPTGFTPEIEPNLYFTPKYKGLVSIELLIFNLWGELIFQTDELNGPGWDGTLNGELLEPGIFSYRFNGVATDGEVVKKGGKFKLIR